MDNPSSAPRLVTPLEMSRPPQQPLDTNVPHPVINNLSDNKLELHSSAVATSINDSSLDISPLTISDPPLSSACNQDSATSTSLSPSVAAIFNLKELKAVTLSSDKSHKEDTAECTPSVTTHSGVVKFSSSFAPSVAAVFDANAKANTNQNIHVNASKDPVSPVSSNVSTFAPSVAAVFAHHKSDKKDSEVPTFFSEKKEQEVNLKGILGISHPQHVQEPFAHFSQAQSQPKLQPPRPRGPSGGVYSYPNGPIMSTGYPVRGVSSQHPQSIHMIIECSIITFISCRPFCQAICTIQTLY